jgi:hypothetical protein
VVLVVAVVVAIEVAVVGAAAAAVVVVAAAAVVVVVVAAAAAAVVVVVVVAVVEWKRRVFEQSPLPKIAWECSVVQRDVEKKNHGSCGTHANANTRPQCSVKQGGVRACKRKYTAQ